MLRNMNEVSARNILIMSAVLTGFAAVIAVGVVYNNARIALAERAWELASLRVLGFTRAEVSLLLLGELGLAIAIALPLGMALGWGLTHGIVELMRSDQFYFPVVIRARTYAFAVLVFAELLRSFGARSETKPVWRISLFTNRNLLIVVAERLRGCLRAEDTLARMGGDELGILIEDAEPLGPYGAKGVGEPGLVPTAPAILGAILLLWIYRMATRRRV